MSDELIRRDDVLDLLNDLVNDFGDNYELYSILFDSVDEMKSAQPKTGRWTLDRVSYLLEYVCTNCKVSFPSIASEGEFYSKLNCANMNFCPNCGAKMEDY